MPAGRGNCPPPIKPRVHSRGSRTCRRLAWLTIEHEAERLAGAGHAPPRCHEPCRPGRGRATVRVLLLDDQELVRTGLRGILRAAFGFGIVGECADGSEVPVA